jgi:VIT1/CCC1 family predicted Fe2+/Mn2+ transporter
MSDFSQPRILYFDGTNVYDTPIAATVGSVFSGQNHTLIALIIGAALYFILYYYKKYDLAAIVFAILVAGISVDFYLNNYYH